jgi:hypothetical protein
LETSQAIWGGENRAFNFDYPLQLYPPGETASTIAQFCQYFSKNWDIFDYFSVYY